MTDSRGSALITAAMIAIGALLLTLCGSCTAFVWISGLSDLAHSGGRGEAASYNGAFLKLSLVVGLLPTLIGALLLWAGLRRRARLRRPRAGPPPG
jgi:hypothetical protein